MGQVNTQVNVLCLSYSPVCYESLMGSQNRNLLVAATFERGQEFNTPVGQWFILWIQPHNFPFEYGSSEVNIGSTAAGGRVLGIKDDTDYAKITLTNPVPRAKCCLFGNTLLRWLVSHQARWCDILSSFVIFFERNIHLNFIILWYFMHVFFFRPSLKVKRLPEITQKSFCVRKLWDLGLWLGAAFTKVDEVEVDPIRPQLKYS